MNVYEQFGHNHKFPDKLGKAAVRIGDTGLQVERAVYFGKCGLDGCHQTCNRHYVTYRQQTFIVHGYGTDDPYIEARSRSQDAKPLVCKGSDNDEHF